jgi:hypothetical protein
MWLERLGKLKKSNYLIKNRTPEITTCSIVPQPTMLLCAPHKQIQKRTMREKQEENL